MSHPLTKLSLDYWYHALMVVGLVIFLAAAAGILRELPAAATMMASAGLFFWGLGEWINHPVLSKLGGGFVVTSHPRSASAIGVCFDAIGLVLIGLGVYSGVGQ